MAKTKGKLILTAYDPKNREIRLIRHKNKFKVIKEATGFTTPWVDSDEAEEILLDQASCSQNTATEYIPKEKVQAKVTDAPVMTVIKTEGETTTKVEDSKTEGEATTEVTGSTKSEIDPATLEAGEGEQE